MWKYVIFFILLFPSISFAEYTIEVIYSFNSVAGKTISNYNLYMDGNLVCISSDILDSNFECSFNAIKGGHQFTMEAVYTDGTKSSLSSEYWFKFGKGGIIRVNGVINLLK